MTDGPYHAGERTVQRRAGVRDVADRVARSIRPAMPAAAQAFLAERTELFIGARDRDGRVWAGALAGPPGFAHAVDARTVRIGAGCADGPLAERLADPAPLDVGLLALDPATRRRMRVNGTAERRGEALLVRTTQVYANCPKYIQRREPAGAAPAPPDRWRRADRLAADDVDLLRRADTLVIATAAPDGAADVSHRGGAPGFIVVTEQRRLAFADHAGNSMFNTLGNLELDPSAGLLVADPDTGRVVHLTGRARVDWHPNRRAAFPGAERVVDLDVDAVATASGPLLAPQRLLERSPHNPPAPAPSPR